ncbi:uncharacterized protein LOC144446532 [Glandiceps talaboti]
MATLSLLPVVGGAQIVKAVKTDHCSKGESMPLSILGGFIHGVGIVMCGACPATILVQLGTGTDNAVVTMAGYLTGALLYGFLDEKIPRRETKLFREGGCTIDDFLKIKNYAILALPLTCGIGVFLSQYPTYLPADTVGGYSSIKCGILLGCVNLPIILTLRKMIGCSSSIVTIASQLVPESFASKYLQSYRSGFKRWWQVLFAVGAVGGAYLSARSTHSLSTISGVTKSMAFGGGMVMIFGARMANGCVCGHGATGVSLLSVLSIASTVAMVAGGLAATKLMQITNMM